MAELEFTDEVGSTDEIEEPKVTTFGGDELGEYLKWFDNLCSYRAEVGAKEYGETAFMENDVMRMMMEELADTVNYCRLQAVKLMALNNAVVDQVDSLKEQEFRGTGEGWVKK